MTRFVTRPMFVLFIAVLAFSGAGYLGNGSLRMNGYLTVGGCVAVRPSTPVPGPVHGRGAVHVDRCALGSDSAWQFPLAIVLVFIAFPLAAFAVRRLCWRRLLPRKALRRFVLSTAVGSARQMLAVVIAVAAIFWAGYLGSHGLNHNTPCPNPPSYFVIQICHGPPSRYWWQVPAAVLLGLGGFGAALAVAGRRRTQRRLPEGFARTLLPR